MGCGLTKMEEPKSWGFAGKLLAYGTLFGAFALSCYSDAVRTPPTRVVSDTDFVPGYVSSVLDATHKVKSGENNGSGASWKYDGGWSYLFTASHVIKEDKNITVDNFRAELVDKFNPEEGDVALIRTTKVFRSYLPIAASEPS